MNKWTKDKGGSELKKYSAVQMKKWIYGVGIFSLLGISLLFLPIWYITDINVVGNHYYNVSEILKVAELEKGMHPLSINKKAATKAIATLPFIEKAQVSYKFPNKITIEVEEQRPIGYVTFHDSYLCLNGDGKVLEQSKEKRLKLPVLEGLSFEYFTIGDILGQNNEEKIQIMNEMIRVLDKYNFTEKIDSIDLSNLEQIHLYVNKLDVIIGNIRDFDKKIKWLVKVNEAYTMGILDLSLVEHGQAVLTPLD